MISSGIKSRQPVREAWMHECLEHECSITLGQSIDTSTWNNYSSALNSYLEFIKIHGFSVNPTPDTLSFFTVFMCYLILSTLTCLEFVNNLNHSSLTSTKTANQ